MTIYDRLRTISSVNTRFHNRPNKKDSFQRWANRNYPRIIEQGFFTHAD